MLNEASAVENSHFHLRSGNWEASKLNETEEVTTNKRGAVSWKIQTKVVKRKFAQKYKTPFCQK